MNAFAGKPFVLRVDEATAQGEDSTLGADLAFLTARGVRPIVIAPNPSAARGLVRTLNRGANSAVGLSGADAGMLPGRGAGIGNVQTGILLTLMQNGYVPVIEPTAFAAFGEDVELRADDVAQAIACATDAVRAIFFHALGGVTDSKTAALIEELTAAEALAIADEPGLPADLRAAIRAAALGVRSGVGAAQIVDGRVAHASIVEVLTAKHLGTQVTGGVYTGG